MTLPNVSGKPHMPTLVYALIAIAIVAVVLHVMHRKG